ncbi:DUF192 domain-containing protein [Streptomyces sp. P9(2023)]|uniref:DUF192 domain-containing protein n=1 Tax=Streptomyces sp. P9(2023) TaxID=3064394 RepID=UPI0028F407BF|nr:DUF192 domain-containing protein [Streptomyces sp. P9(2023)]MDT9688467.1 DUF192 domain-containing protein [Streptomyces sp. P9(2023)]
MGPKGRPGKWRDGGGTLLVAEDPIPPAPQAPLAPLAPQTPLAPLEIAASYRARRRGLLGRDGIEGAMLITRTNSIHTFGMRFAIDVAYLDRNLTVLAVVTMRPGRLGMVRPRGRHVLETEAGAMAGWGLRKGVRVTVVPSQAA